MSASRVRSEYETLGQIAHQFSRHAEAWRAMLQQMQHQLAGLQGGDWFGKGSDKFYQEMSASLLPSLERLAAALEIAAQTTRQISRIMKQAEDDAARCFRLNDQVVASANGATAVSVMAAFGPSLPGEGDGGAAGSSSLAGAGVSLASAAYPANPDPWPDVEDGRGAKTKLSELKPGVATLVKEKAPPFTALRNRQIGEAIKKYNIELGAATRVIYDPSLTEDGKTDDDGTIRIGPKAFDGSPGYLAETIDHETRHIQQWKEERWAGSNPPGDEAERIQLGAMNEIEAYDRALANATRYGLTEDERIKLWLARQEHYMLLNDENARRADRGIYTLE